MLSITYAYAIIILPLCFAGDLIECIPPDGQASCVCQTEDGIIDLTTIALHNQKPKFKQSYDAHSYDYNPCYGFGVGSDNCASGVTAICQDQHVVVGLITSERMYHDGKGNYELHYSKGDDERHAVVYLDCDETDNQPRISTTGDKAETFAYVFHLYTNQTCFISPGGSSSSSSSAVHVGYIGLGIIFVTIASVLIYFIVGGLICKFSKKQKGTDVIPNKKFWLSLPYLVKDGIMVIVSPIARKKYQSI
ncbi:PREDICTED: uncharacterized protein LOC109581532 [Amphimedon queenslandica]|uniref:Autophagy-related protein 27 n=1 Tax=Amphimedon queenslandica TaxID=400682 RepID=A0AAN0J2Q6_AMPQE|nr:PREDICTED: uncharacterized protein LOC109581532 [Amphimedon queenslandica]|eukprot:XP_019851285.1 PREDICTED: uncharacterized protein LOC109581532 [Amphimedon queenslandica]